MLSKQSRQMFQHLCCWTISRINLLNHEILTRVEHFVENQIAIGDARENIDLLQEIVVQVEDQVETSDDNESMDVIELFDSEEDLEKVFATWSESRV